MKQVYSTLAVISYVLLIFVTISCQSTSHKTVAPADRLEGFAYALEEISVEDSKQLGIVLKSQGLTMLPEAFWAKKNWQMIDLEKNRFSKLDSRLGEIENLEDLNLAANQLVELPSKLPISLKTLILSENPLVSLEPAVLALSNLQLLDLRNCNKLELTLDWPKFSQLKELRLANLAKLRLTGLEKLQELLFLDLSQNRISKPDPIIAQLSQLEILWLNHNLLQNPKNLAELGSLTKLRELQLSNNTLNQFPGFVLSLVNLEKINLAQNRISEIPSEIQNLKALEFLDLRGNPINETTKKQLSEWLPETEILY